MSVWSRPLSAAALAVGMLAPLSALQAQTAGEVIKTATHPEHGVYLTDGAGYALYLFEEDRPEGERGRPVESDCLDECLGRWPPFSPDALPEAEGEADASLLASFERPDGGTQLTYNGWPLYYFVEDFGPGDTNGHDFEEFGGEWYLLTPAGHALGEDLDDDKRNREDDESG